LTPATADSPLRINTTGSRRGKLKLIFRKGQRAHLEEASQSTSSSTDPRHRSGRGAARKVLEPLRNKTPLQSRTLFDFPSSANNPGRQMNNNIFTTRRSKLADSNALSYSHSSAYSQDDTSSLLTSRQPTYQLRKASTCSDSATLRKRDVDLPARHHSQSTLFEPARVSVSNIYIGSDSDAGSTSQPHLYIDSRNSTDNGNMSTAGRPTSINIPSLQILQDQTIVSS